MNAKVVAAAIILIYSATLPSFSAEDPAAHRVGASEFDAGKAAFQKHNYTSASQLFWKSITEGNPDAGAWLWLARADERDKRYEDAIKHYTTVQNVFKGTPEAAQAAKSLSILRNHPLPPAKLSEPTLASMTSTPHTYKPLKDRISVMPPAPGHPPVSPRSVQIVTYTIVHLPSFVYSILDDANTTVVIAPNITDKWPDAINTPKPGQEELLLSEEGGRTYGRDIYIYERAIIRGTNRLGPARSETEMKDSVLNLVGHALNDSMGVLSKLESFRAAYKEDVAAMTPATKAYMHYYLQPGDVGPGETCAAIICSELGGKLWERNRLVRNFPKTRAWIKAKVHV